MKVKEKRDTVLYANVTLTNKNWLQDAYKKHGYSTLSEFVDDLLTDVQKTAIKTTINSRKK